MAARPTPQLPAGVPGEKSARQQVFSMLLSADFSALCTERP
ncbi:hypothetical protein CLV64_109211 [Micromonospora phaseoli]|nr:hypothetical protein CLV64_109211 [Micromonospora phaseoli]